MSTSKPLATTFQNLLFAAAFEAERLAQAQFSGEGAVAALENAYKTAYHQPYALGVPSGTAALEALFRAAKLGPGDEIITTPFTVGATIAGALRCGCTIVFTDVQADTLCLDPVKAEKAITKATKAMLPVDALGTPHDILAFRHLTSKYALYHFADACESYGALTHGLPASFLADALVTSFTAC